MTRDKILEAAALEIERNALTQFRVKRVALEANISIALLLQLLRKTAKTSSPPTVVYRFRQGARRSRADLQRRRSAGVKTADELRAALTVMITDAQLPFRTEARILRIESMSFAGHNPTASAGIAAASAKQAI